ncbi:type VII secretion protein EccB [Micromonospora sp. WMMD1128]|uniref:type VII secretion protein EccB n=1 Tax=Micromonospora sp. WMMD1128 TaxID=3015150 RepID=UPI00248C7B83|nr:type VII secretion protein EccB [Micromonospora sp. WMMD1128]WBB71953.1 type VII secretion protein EccB [Micromonospora sp. WMMD1128]
MQTQRDHVHAHSFMTGRLSSALVQGEPTSAQIPGQRALTGLLIGIIVVLLVGGGFAVYGWIVPGGSRAYGQAGAILVEKESGVRYVYRDGVLYPTPNLTSAMLLQGPSAAVKLISRNSLKDLPRGPEIGIADAPQSVPGVDALVRGPWLACLPGSVVDRPGAKLGMNLDPRAPATPLTDDTFAVVRGPDRVTYVLAGPFKFPVADESVLVALGAANARVAFAPAAWLDELPTGATLGAARIPDAGTPGPRVAGRVRPVGTLFRQQPAAGAEQLFVLRPDGLAPVNRMEFVLATVRGGDAPVTLDAADVAGAPRSRDRTLADRLPDLTGHHWHDPGREVLCLRQRPFNETVTSEIVFAERYIAGIFDDGTPMVVAEPGSGMTVTPIPKARPVAETVLISDEGIAYRLADADAVASLKLASSAAVPFPKGLLAAMPQGPTLSRKAVNGPARG